VRPPWDGVAHGRHIDVGDGVQVIRRVGINSGPVENRNVSWRLRECEQYFSAGRCGPGVIDPGALLIPQPVQVEFPEPASIQVAGITRRSCCLE
jgi:hypothetical protein